MLLKVVALGIKDYSRDAMNLFDGTLVLISIADVIIEQTTIAESSDISVITVFRTFRILRILKLITKSKQQQILILAIKNSFKELFNYFLLLFLFLFSCSLVGMELFAFKI